MEGRKIADLAIEVQFLTRAHVLKFYQLSQVLHQRLFIIQLWNVLVYKIFDFLKIRSAAKEFYMRRKLSLFS